MTTYDQTAPSDPCIVLNEALEIADKMVQKYMDQDDAFPSLFDKMRVTPSSGPTLSGLQENDYPNSLAFPNTVMINQLKLLNKIPLPPEILEQCGNVQRDFMMGLFPEINRAWLTVDSDIYLWNFETGGDVAYYDGLSEYIVSVGLVKPKEGVFQGFIKYLLILTTAAEIVVLGVMLNPSLDKKYGEELQLTPDVIYVLSTDGTPIASICGTRMGRIFMGGKDGSLFEIVYQNEIGWWGQRCKKVNHSKGALSYLLPAFINSAFYEDDAIVQIAVDNSRNILYTLTEKSSIEVFDLGADGLAMARVASITHSTLLNHIGTIVNTLDMKEISKVVTLCPLEVTDSQEIGVVGVTESGVRLYLSTGYSYPHRPSTLHVVHVRLPTGYSSNSEVFNPSQVISSIQKRGNFYIISALKESDHDKLWCLTGDNFPMKHWFSETCSSYIVPGQSVTLAMKETTNEKLQGPLLMHQHNYPSEKLVVLTQQGTEIYEALRPIDVLAELLRERDGPDCEVIKQYFAIQGNDQACATALVLACNQRLSAQMVEWATRAFFLYGGSPKQILQTPPQQPQVFQYSLPAGFKPNTVSTPIGNKTNIASLSGTETYTYQMSAKHNSLYLYISRILRPIWTMYIIERVKGSEGREFLTSSVQSSQMISISGQLLALKQFLEKHTQMSTNTFNHVLYPEPSTTIHEIAVTSPNSQRSRSVLQEAIAHERKSLESLKLLVEQATQVLGFWRIMCEHQFHVINEPLPQEQQQQLLTATFRDLILVGQDLCSSLINKLINSYLSDNTSVDAISLKLREVCPTLYRSEDAACSKANEILKIAKDELDPEEKLSLLRSAIQLCKSVSPHVSLSWVCKQLVVCKYYEGVLELSYDTASKVDPSNLAKHFFLAEDPIENSVEHKAYMNRTSAYKDVVAMLDHLHQQCQFRGNNSPLLSSGNQSNSQPQAVLEDVLTKCLNLDDEVIHVVVYQWLVARELHASLVSLGRPSLERFLMRYQNSDLQDLLWQYHERIGNHAQAAQLLYALANTEGECINLQQRLTYLGKAVMCMRCDGAGCAPQLGIFLHELEDLVQVARVQKQIFDKLSNLGTRDQQTEIAIKKLNSKLLTITELFEDFAEPFGMWECKLTILDCAGHDDRDLINLIWDNIISEELTKCSGSSSDDQMLIIMSKVKSLGLQFTVQSPCIPLPHLVWQLEVISCRLDVNKSHVHSTLLSIGVPVGSLLEIYDKMFTINDRCWLLEGNEFHLIQVIASFADSFIANPKIAPMNERKSIAVRMHDLITNCLSTLYSKPDTKQLQAYLKTIQANLNRIP